VLALRMRGNLANAFDLCVVNVSQRKYEM